MKKGIVLNLKRFKFLDYVTQNRIFILLSLLYVIGIIISVSALSDNNRILNNAKTYLTDYISLHSSSNFLNKFLKCFLRYFIILVLYFICGTSMFGVVVTPFLTLWQGIFFGALASQLYSLYGIGGIAFNAIIIIPPTLIFVISCFFAAKHSIDFSISLARLSLPRTKPASLYITLKKYCSVYLILLGITFINTLVDITLNILFLKFFNF